MNVKVSKKQCTILLNEDDKYSELKKTETVNLDSLDKVILDFVNIKRVNSHVLNMIIFLRKNFDKDIFIISADEFILKSLKTFGVLHLFKVNGV